MTSIDDIFKGANAAAKRKFENPSDFDPSQSYKTAKLNSDSDVKKSPRASVADEDDDEEAGPSLPPDFEPEDGDDEEGRFFGGNLDDNAIDAIDYLDAQDGEGAIVEEKFDLPWLRKLALGFDKKITKNSELRARYEDDPAKFMASEGDLDEGIKNLSILSEHPELYAEVAKGGIAANLVQLLAHENTDIAIDAIEIISELTDEDVVAEQAQWEVLVAAMLEADLLSLLISNFSRFDESEEVDRSGVYHSLSVLENLLSQPTNLDPIGSEVQLLSWLLERIQRKESTTSQNKLYASEILSILTQSSSPNRRRVIEANGIELLLTQLEPYRRLDPAKDSEEEEYFENLFNCLTSLVDESPGKRKFLDAEGVELCLLMIRSSHKSKSRALKVIDHACSTTESSSSTTQTNGSSSSSSDPKPPADESPQAPTIAVCTKLITSRGLKPLFTTFMKTKRHDPQTTEHILSTLSSLLRSLPGNSDPRYRLLAKFLEKDYEKIHKLVALRRDYVTRVAAFDSKLAERKQGLSKEEQEEIDMESISARLEEGLFCLERIDAVLAWLVAEDDGAKGAIVKALAERDEGLADVKRTLQAQLDGVLQVEAAEREMLETLVGFL